MIYEIRTYDLMPESIPEFEKRFAESLPGRLSYSQMAGLWHTEIGPLNQVVHVWPYDDLNQRVDIRERAITENWPPNTSEFHIDHAVRDISACSFHDSYGGEKYWPDVRDEDIYLPTQGHTTGAGGVGQEY